MIKNPPASLLSQGMIVQIGSPQSFLCDMDGKFYEGGGMGIVVAGRVIHKKSGKEAVLVSSMTKAACWKLAFISVPLHLPQNWDLTMRWIAIQMGIPAGEMESAPTLTNISAGCWAVRTEAGACAIAGEEAASGVCALSVPGLATTGRAEAVRLIVEALAARANLGTP